jgi:hypothetical protein
MAELDFCSVERCEALDSIDKMHRTDFKNGIAVENSKPQGLKPTSLAAPGGTAKAVPFPRPFMKPVPGPLIRS